MKNQAGWQRMFSIGVLVRRTRIGILVLAVVLTAACGEARSPAPADLLGVQVSAQEILDQENAPVWTGGWTNIQTQNEVGQSFQPSCNNLYRVDVDLVYTGGDGSVTAKVLRNGTPIPGAHAQAFVSQDGWVELELDSVVDVTPDETLVLRLEHDPAPSSPFPGWKFAGDTYPRGTRLFAGQTQSGDFFFRTYSTSCGTSSAIKIDIKPGSDPNSINCGNQKGVIAVAILTTDDFDATTVDHTTVTFEGAGETHVDKRSREARRHEEDVDDDGDVDLVFHFRLGDTALTCKSTEGALIGETFDGLSVEGSDGVRMVGQLP